MLYFDDYEYSNRTQSRIVLTTEFAETQDLSNLLA